MIAAALTIACLILTLAQFKLFHKPYNNWKISIFVLLLLSSIVSIWDAHITETRTQQDSDTLRVANIKIDSLNRQLLHAKKEIQDIVKFSSQNEINQTKLTEQNITDAVARGVRIGVKEVRVNKNSLSQQIRDSINSGTDAFVTSVTGMRHMTHRQSHDSLFIYAEIDNKGDKPTKHLTCNGYFIYCDNVGRYAFEYRNPILSIIDADLPGRHLCGQSTGDSFVPNYNFDSSNGRQWILILGTYNQTEKIRICYTWDNVNNIWNISNDERQVERLHLSKDLKHF